LRRIRVVILLTHFLYILMDEKEPVRLAQGDSFDAFNRLIERHKNRI
jgi:hypothetical protein